MNRFDRYLLSQLLIVFGFFSLILVLVYWVNRAVRLFDRLIGDGHSTLVFLELSALTLPGITELLHFLVKHHTVLGTKSRILASIRPTEFAKAFFFLLFTI